VVNAEHLVLSEMLVQVSGQLPEGFAVLAKWLLNNDSCVPSPVNRHTSFESLPCVYQLNLSNYSLNFGKLSYSSFMERSTNQRKLYTLKQIYVPSSDSIYARKQPHIPSGNSKQNLQLLQPTSHMQC